MLNKKIGIIGGGNMGEALFSRLSAVLEKSVALMVSETDAARRDYLQTKYKIIPEIDNNLLVKYSDIVILAVKPKDFEKILREEVCCGISKEKLLISIAAGITTGYIEGIVGEGIPVIRVMPNMAAVVGEAISSLSCGGAAKEEHMAIAKEIFSTMGDVVEVDERLLDAVTAVSGSGPAYFFCLIEALIDAAQKLGLDSLTARKLVAKTAIGSARMFDMIKEDPAVLIKKVASKGGTTEAAFKVFEERCFRAIVHDAVEQAHRRSKELSRR